MGFPLPLQKVKMLLGFPGYGAGVEGPRELFCQVNTKEFDTLDILQGGSIESSHSVVS